ncbi:glycosyltransferase [Microbacterium sp. NPDC086615]|uniref:glycosyltransferase n=1 Tax=Microbacterium sp. NPDC086615 TaxID=3154865 RepID=UPI00343CEB65
MTYIESATRATRLSLTGRVINLLPFIERRVQHEQLANERWSFRGSVFDQFTGAKTVADTRDVNSIFVSLGANQHVGFRPLIERILEITPPSVDVYFQYGPTDVRDLSIQGKATMTWQEVHERSRAADVVITHAGTGSILTTLLASKIPIIVPRSGATGQHVDEHQSDLAAYAQSVGLAIAISADQLDWSHVLQAAAMELRKSRVDDELE